MRKCNIFICLMLIMILGSLLFAPYLYAQGTTNVVIDETVIEPKDPIMATVIAIGPGLLVHGWGQFYSEDYKTGLLLFGTEFASLVTLGIGYIEYSSPSNLTTMGGNNNTVQRAGETVMIVAGVLFVASWLSDISMAGGAARQYNIEHGLEFKMQQESYNNSTMFLTYNYRF